MRRSEWLSTKFRAHFVARLSVSLFSLGLFVLWTGVAAAWDLSCVNGRVCVYKDSEFRVPMAADIGSEWSYVGDYYPNTGDSINDSVSSLKNLYQYNDVVFYHDVGYSGSAFCVDSYWQYSWVGLLNNDRFSSHLVAIDDSAC